MAQRIIRVRYAGNCSGCTAPVAAKSEAWWDAEAKKMRCTACGPQARPAAEIAEAPSGLPVVETRAVEGHSTGAAAAAELERITVRYAGVCAGCGVALPAGGSALYERAAKAMTCLTCAGEVEPTPDATAPAGASEGATPTPSVLEVSTPAPATPVSEAGGSAMREYERRKAKREAAIRTRHPRLGGLILFLSDEPQSTTAWAKGAVGEQKLGAGLDSLAAAGVVSLHDRRIPGSKANIDHLAITPSGVWVIDAKRYSGQVVKRDVGGWFSTDLRLYVGRRDCTKLVSAMSYQVAAVRKALGDDWPDVPVRPGLCFVDAEWGLFAKPFELDGVLVTWAKALRERLGQPGPYTREGLELLAAALEKKLKPAT